MNKVVIIGAPGSGKSTFARELAKRTGLPLIHLDYYYHDKNFDYEFNKEAWRRKVKELIKGEKWIIEGNYSSTYDVRLPAADTIIYFEVSKYTAVWRVAKRRVQYHKKARPDMPSSWKETADINFLRYVWGFSAKYSLDIRTILKRYKDKDIFIITTSEEAQSFLKENT